VALFKRSESTGPATETLRETVTNLPDNPSDWTAEQRATHHEQSNAAMREQAERP